MERFAKIILALSAFHNLYFFNKCIFYSISIYSIQKRIVAQGAGDHEFWYTHAML